MVVCAVGELARIGDADLGLRGELQSPPASTSAASLPALPLWRPMSFRRLAMVFLGTADYKLSLD
jgi:hypothetical protein